MPARVSTAKLESSVSAALSEIKKVISSDLASRSTDLNRRWNPYGHPSEHSVTATVQVAGKEEQSS